MWRSLPPGHSRLRLQKSRRRIAPVIRSHFVDLIQQKYRIIYADIADRCDNAARNRTYIRSSVAPDFGFIVDTAQGHAHKFSADGTGDRSSD